MALELALQINNEDVTDYSTAIRVTSEAPVINWDFDQVERVTVDEYTGDTTSESSYGQLGYEIRISTSTINIGTDSFIGNRIQTGFVDSQEKFWIYTGYPLERGGSYYGQIRVTDDANRQSFWYTFAFDYNSLPYVSGISISPSSPCPTDSITLSYTFNDDDGDTESGTLIRWFKNGVYQKQHDGSLQIDSDFLQTGDTWAADISPSDGYEHGIRSSSPHVYVKKTALVVSNVRILPVNPNDNDVLKVDYTLSDNTRNEGVSIRWYVNDKILTAYNNQLYIRPDVAEGDIVSCEVRTASASSYVSSPDITIVASDFEVGDITVDGRIEPLDVSTITPSIKWRSFVPSGKEVNYVSIRIGTFYEASNVYSQILTSNKEVFTIPANTLQKGVDYYLSVSISDTQTFDKYTSTHFRVKGSRWETNVSNSTGWTIETLFIVQSDGTEDEDYQIVRISDGTKFAEVRIHADKIGLLSGTNTEYEADETFVGSHILTIAGRGSNIKVYLDRELVIDGTGSFTQTTTEKRLWLGSPHSNDFEVHYKYFFYTTAGYYLPDVASEFTQLQFHTLYEFSDSEVLALNSYKEGEKVFAVNPDNENESSSVYSIVSGDVFRRSTVTRTFAPINKIRTSPRGNFMACAHSKGVRLIEGYAIGAYGHELLFIDDNGDVTNIYPEQVEWELVQTTGYTAAYFDALGFNINTIGTLD